MSWFNMGNDVDIDDETFKLKQKYGKEIRFYDEMDNNYFPTIDNWLPIPIYLTPELQKKMNKLLENSILNPFGNSFITTRTNTEILDVNRTKRKYQPKINQYGQYLDLITKRKVRTPIPIFIKQMLINERGKICEHCHNTEFDQFHHINNDPTDHRIENLELLCYRCHLNTRRVK